MERLIVLYKSDLEALQKDEAVLVYIDDIPFTICTVKYYENDMDGYVKGDAE